MRHLLTPLTLLALSHLSSHCLKASADLTAPVFSSTQIHAPQPNGHLVIEAENFFLQTRAFPETPRAWYRTSADAAPSVTPDIDPPHAATASGGAYVEVLPDESTNAKPNLIPGVSFSDHPGHLAVLHYRVFFPAPGRYIIWTRALGTDGDDNTAHLGLDDTWPQSSARMHLQGGGTWTWASKYRTSKERSYLDVLTSGVRTLQISMREDGCELDQFLLTTDPTFAPPVDQSPAPAPRLLDAPPPFIEQNGLVVMEAESVGRPHGWEANTFSTHPHTGPTSLRWSLPGQARKPGEGELTFTFRIETSGTYQLHLRSRLTDPKNRPETPDPDGNDTWLRFESGADISGQPELGTGKWQKLAALGHPESWTWSTHADKGPPHNPRPITRQFAAGVHTLKLSGRSEGHIIDRLVLRRYEGSPAAELTSEDATRLTAAPESAR